MATLQDIGPDTKILDDAGRDWAWAFVIYRDVAGWPGYKVGTNQTVWSNRRQAGGITDWHRLKLVVVGGYYCTTLFGIGGRRMRKLHVLMLEAFIGPRPADMFGCHNDGNPANCRLSNLRWDTPKANAGDKARHGTWQGGEKNARSKLADDQVREIRRLFTLQTNPRDKRTLASRFGVSTTLIRYIVTNQIWTHV